MYTRTRLLTVAVVLFSVLYASSAPQASQAISGEAAGASTVRPNGAVDSVPVPQAHVQPVADAPPTADAQPRGGAALGPGGFMYERKLRVQKVRFRRDGDPFGGRGELKIAWNSEYYTFPGQLVRNGNIPANANDYLKIRHSKKSKKCTDPGCCGPVGNECTPHWSPQCGNYNGECRWFSVFDAEPASGVIFQDTFVGTDYCNPVSVELDFLENDHWDAFDRTVGDYANQLISSPPPPSYPALCSTDCLAGAISNTPGNKPAQVELRWEVKRVGPGTSSGPSCDPDACGEIDNFMFGHSSLTMLRFRIALNSINLLDNTFVGTTQFLIPIDADNQLATGASGDMCGAEYRVGLELMYNGVSDPSQFLYYERWNGSAWQLTANAPFDLEFSSKIVAFNVMLTDIGNPPINSTIACWARLERNGFPLGTRPCDPCNERLPLQLFGDDLCPYVVLVDSDDLEGGDTSASVKIRFSEPMSPISPGDLLVTPPLPSGTTLSVSMSDFQRLLTVSASPSWPSGTPQITLLGSITDLAGNGLSSSSDPSLCGVNVPLSVCVDDGGLTVANQAGQRIQSVSFGQPVYFKGEGFAPNTQVKIYLVQVDGLDRIGKPLVDFTDSGPRSATTDAAGQLASTNIGIPVAIDEYGVVVDLDLDSVLDPEDRIQGRCRVPLSVGPPCDDAPGPPAVLWSMDQKVGSGVGERGKGLHGRLIGPGVWTAGRVNGALRLNGSSYVSVDPDPEYFVTDTDFSVCGWISTTVASQPILSHVDVPSTNGGYILALLNGQPSFELDNGPLSNVFVAASAPRCDDGQWHHVAVTVDRLSPAGLIIYVDGMPVLTADPTALQGWIQQSSALRIGSDHQSFFNGSVDELGLYDEALSHSDVAMLASWGYEGGCYEDVSSVPSPLEAAGHSVLRPPFISPNPSSDRVSVDFAIPRTGATAIAVFDVSGREVKRMRLGSMAAGRHQVEWDLRDHGGRRVPAGLYFINVSWNGQSATETTVVLK